MKSPLEKVIENIDDYIRNGGFSQEFVNGLSIAKQLCENQLVTSYKEPHCFVVTHGLHSEFRSLVESHHDCCVVNVIELKSGEDGFLQYTIQLPKEKDKLISDYAFMTFIKNPVFQKYYHDTKAFHRISEKYIKDKTEINHNEKQNLFLAP